MKFNAQRMPLILEHRLAIDETAEFPCHVVGIHPTREAAEADIDARETAYFKETEPSPQGYHYWYISELLGDRPGAAFVPVG
jgi:hypothetical protein